MVHAQNALLIQSRLDEFGRSHSDGWGIAYYEDQQPHVERNASAAHHGLHFSNAAERVYSPTVISHVRLATVGTPTVENCHPFRFGKWVFAHNGTVQGINQLQSTLRNEMSADLRNGIVGQTDSELLFHWLMQRLLRRRVVDEQSCLSLDESVDVIAESLSWLDQRCREVVPSKPAKLNTVLTDGRIMIASRLRNSLHWTHRDGIRDCEICGIPHVNHQPGFHYKAVVLASEPLSHEQWIEIPDGSIVSIDSQMETRSIPMQFNSKANSDLP